MVALYVDMHVHCSELQNIENYTKSGEIVLVCVSDDYDSSMNTLKLAEKYDKLEACIGVHPWVAHEYSASSIRSLLDTAISKYDVKCLGEVGLDKRFKADTFEKQLEIFNVVVEYAREYGLVLNLHAADAWREVFEIVSSKDIEKAYFHWYTGPLDLMELIQSSGYFIGVNPAWMLQQKHRVVLEQARIEHIITESDAPYNYRGLQLVPDMVKKTVEYITLTRKLNIEQVRKVIYGNYSRLFGKL